jgi:3-phosphoshikimate 1-carboxyvinyltransferase
MASCLTAFGVPVEEKPDGMVVRGGARIRGNTEADSRWDHRIAMAASVLALFADGPARILGTDSIATSYPGFWADMAKLTGRPALDEEETP